MSKQTTKVKGIRAVKRWANIEKGKIGFIYYQKISKGQAERIGCLTHNEVIQVLITPLHSGKGKKK